MEWNGWAAVVWWPVYCAVGAIAGFLAGLLGVGGGLLLVPALVVLLPHSGMTADVLMQVAVATSLGSIVFTSIASTRAHHQKGAVHWSRVALLAPTMVAGAMLVAPIVVRWHSDTLALLFAVFAVWMALRMAWPRPVKTVPVGLPPRWYWRLAGLFIGFLSGIVGIGGGSLTVPLLLRYGETMNRAVATSAACGMPIALFGSLSYALTDAPPTLPAGTVGLVYLPAVLLLTVGSWFTAPVGARLTHTLPASRLKQFFALFLMLVAIRMVYSVIF